MASGRLLRCEWFPLVSGNDNVFFMGLEGGVREPGGDTSRLDILLMMSDVDGKASGSVPLSVMIVMGVEDSTPRSN